MTGKEITIGGPDGDFMGYLAMPASGSGHGVVVIQEIFGVTTSMRKVADNLAAAGYIALCPDLFWRLEPGFKVDSGDDEAGLQKAFAHYGNFDVEKSIGDLKVAMSHLRGLDGYQGKVGTVGYCLGGFLAYLMAAHTDADASVGYYGVGIESKLADASKISHPLMLHVAEEDQFVPKDAQAQVAEGLKGNSQVTIFSYAGVDHGFARESGDTYARDAAETANGRTVEFLNANLAG